MKSSKRPQNKSRKPSNKKRGRVYADVERVKGHESLAVDFFDKILNMNYFDCFISDKSSLADFNEDKQFKKDVIEQVNDIYGVDITDTFDKKLVDVLDKIKSRS
jgi:hypothetical protein